MTYRAWRSARDWVFLADVTEDLRRHVVSRWITTFVRTGSTWRRSYAEHRVGFREAVCCVNCARAVLPPARCVATAPHPWGLADSSFMQLAGD